MQRKSVKTDEQDFVEGITKEAEKAAATKNMEQLYDTTTKLAGEFKEIRASNQTQKWGCPDRGGQTAFKTGRETAQLNQPDIQPAETDRLIDCNIHTREERNIITIVNRFKNPFFKLSRTLIH